MGVLESFGLKGKLPKRKAKANRQADANANAAAAANQEEEEEEDSSTSLDNEDAKRTTNDRSRASRMSNMDFLKDDDEEEEVKPQEQKQERKQEQDHIETKEKENPSSNPHPPSSSSSPFANVNAQDDDLGLKLYFEMRKHAKKVESKLQTAKQFAKGVTEDYLGALDEVPLPDESPSNSKSDSADRNRSTLTRGKALRGAAFVDESVHRARQQQINAKVPDSEHWQELMTAMHAESESSAEPDDADSGRAASLFATTTLNEGTKGLERDPLFKEKVHAWTLASILYPVDVSRRKHLDAFREQNFEIVRNVFAVNNQVHASALSIAESMCESVINLLEQRERRIDEAVHVAGPSKKKVADLTNDSLRLVRTPETMSEAPFKEWSKAATKSVAANIKILKAQPQYEAVLKVNVLSAKDLAIKDPEFGTSDPYCKLTIRDSTKGKRAVSMNVRGTLISHRTKVKYKDLNPVWVESFEFPLDEDKVENYVLAVHMYDKDKLSKDDFMGRVEVPIQSLKHQRGVTEWYPLLPKKDQNEKPKPPKKEKKGLGKALQSAVNAGKSAARKVLANDIKGELQLELKLSFRRRANATAIPFPSNQELHLMYDFVLRSFVLRRLKRSQKRRADAAKDLLERGPASSAQLQGKIELAAGYLNPYTLTLLDELEQRFGIEKSWFYVSLLRVLSEEFVPEAQILARTTAALGECERLRGNPTLATTGRCLLAVPNYDAKNAQNVLSLQESDIVDVCVKNLRSFCDNTLLKYPDAFANTQMDGSLAAVIRLRAYIARWRENSSDADIQLLMNRFITENAKRVWFELSNKLGPDYTLIEVCDSITTHLVNDITLFEPEFRAFDDEISVFSAAAKLYSEKLLIAAGDSMVKWTQQLSTTDTATSRSLTANVFGLYFALQEFNELVISRWESSRSNDLAPTIPLNSVFGAFLTDWREKSRDKLVVYMRRFLAGENWRALADRKQTDNVDQKTQELIDRVGGATLNITEDTLHSSSLADVFALLTESVRFLLQFSDTTRKQSVSMFISRVFIYVVEAYLTEVRRGYFLKIRRSEQIGMSIDWSELMKRGGQAGNQLDESLAVVTSEECVRLNNVYATQFLTMQLVEKLQKKFDDSPEEELDGWFASLKKSIQSSVETMVDSLVTRLDQDLQPAVGLCLHVGEMKRFDLARGATANLSDLDAESSDLDRERRLGPLFAYLNAQLGVLAVKLYPGLFKAVLQKLFLCVMNSFERIVLPCVSKFEFIFNEKHSSEKHLKSHAGKSLKHSGKHKLSHPEAAVRDRAVCVQQATLAHDIMGEIAAFFEADGEGLRKVFVSRHTEPLKKSLTLFQLDAGDLQRIYVSQQKLVERLAREDNLSKDDVQVDIFAKRGRRANTTSLQQQGFPLFHILSVLATFAHVDPAAKEFVRANAGSVRQAFLVERFGCDRLEELEATFACTCEHVSGTIYLTDKSLCFDPLIGGAFGYQPLRIPFDKMKTLTKFRVALLPTGLRIRTQEDEDHTFGALLMRSKLVDLLAKFLSPNVVIINQKTTDALGGDITEDKSEEFRQKFADKIPTIKTENLLRKINCTYYYFPPGQAGVLQVSENYVTFYSRLAPRVVLPFARIDAITKSKGKGFSLFADNGLEFTSQAETFQFQSFSNRDLVYQTLVQMWQARR